MTALHDMRRHIIKGKKGTQQHKSPLKKDGSKRGFRNVWAFHNQDRLLNENDKGEGFLMAGERRTEAIDLNLLEAYDIEMSSADKKTKKKKKSGQIISISHGSSAKAKRRKRNPVMIITVSLLTLIVAAVAILLVHFNAQLNEINEQINDNVTVLTELKNKQSQYQLTIDSKLTDDFVRKYAEEKLDMVPAKNAQKKFISLSDGDKGEVVNDGKSDNIFRTIFDAFGM